MGEAHGGVWGASGQSAHVGLRYWIGLMGLMGLISQNT